MARYRADLIETAWGVEKVYGTYATTLNQGWGLVTAGITLPDPRYDHQPFYGVGVDDRNLLTYIQGRQTLEGSIGTIMLCHDNSRLILGDSLGQIFNATPVDVANSTGGIAAGCTVTATNIKFHSSYAHSSPQAIRITTQGDEPTHIVVISPNNTDAPNPYEDVFGYVGLGTNGSGSNDLLDVHHSMNTATSVDVGWQGKVGTLSAVRKAAIYPINRAAVPSDLGFAGVLAPTNRTHRSIIGIRETLKLNSFTLGSKITSDNGKTLTSNYNGSKVTGFGFNFAEGAPVTFNTNWISKDMRHDMSGGAVTTILKYDASTVDPSMVQVTEQPYFFSKANIKFGGTTFAKFRTLTLTVANQLDPRYYLTQSSNTDNRQVLSEILEGRRAITFSGQVDMDDTATGAAAGSQAGPDIKFLQHVLNQGWNQNDPRNAFSSDLIGLKLEIELKRFSDAANSKFDTLTITLPGKNTTVSNTNPGLILNAARMPIPAPPQVHQNIDIEGVAASMRVEFKDSTA